MAVIGKITAVLMLGAKRVLEGRERVVKRERRWSWRRWRYEEYEEREPEIEWLGRRVLEEVSPGVLMKVLTKRLMVLGVTDFFGITTSLSGANQLRRTREVETQSGAR